MTVTDTGLERTGAPDRSEATGDARPARASGSGTRVLRFALANLRRRPERAALAVAGIALAIAAVVVVRTIAAGYQVSGVAAVSEALDGAPFWVVPEAGVSVDPAVGVVMAEGPVPGVATPEGWAVETIVTTRLDADADVAVLGDSTADGGVAVVSPEAADRLDVAAGDRLALGGTDLAVEVDDGAGIRVTVPLDVATGLGATDGWLRLRPPDGAAGRAAEVEATTGLDVQTDPSQTAASGSGGLVYSTDTTSSRVGFLSFEQKFAALLGGQVTSSVLGLISQVGLVLGFVIAVSTFVAAVAERKREFGIMASVGLTDEVLYFFLVESALLFVTAYVLGVVVGGALVLVVVPGFFSLSAWLEASGLVAMYLPALGVIAALVPVHRLLQQRPVALLADG